MMARPLVTAGYNHVATLGELISVHTHAFLSPSSINLLPGELHCDRISRLCPKPDEANLLCGATPSGVYRFMIHFICIRHS